MSAARVLFRSGVSAFFACEQPGGVIRHIGIRQGIGEGLNLIVKVIGERLTIVVLAQSLPAKCIAPRRSMVCGNDAWPH